MGTVEILTSLLYRKQGFITHYTPQQADYGVYLVVFDKGEKGYALVQCKHSKGKNLSPDGVREVLAARKYYEGQYQTTFPILSVVSNADPTTETSDLAKSNNVDLIDRAVLSTLLRKYPITFSEVIKESSMVIE